MPPDFAKDVAPIFAKYCVGCHNADEPESNLSLETFDHLADAAATTARLSCPVARMPAG